MLVKNLLTIAVASVLLLGIKAWGEEIPELPNKHVVDGLVGKFREDLEKFEKGIQDPKLAKNFSMEALLFRRSMLVLKNSTPDKSEIKSLKDFTGVEKALRALIAKDPNLAKLKDKKALTVADLSAIEGVLLESKKDSDKELMGRLAVLADVETEKAFDGELNTEQALKKLARRKMTTLSKETPIGKGTPLFEKIDDALTAQLKEKKVDRKPTLADLSEALKGNNLPLTPEELLELNTSLAPVQIQEAGGISSNETLRQLYRGFASRQGKPDREILRDAGPEVFFDRFEATTPARPVDPDQKEITELKQLKPFRKRGTLRGGGGGTGSILQGNSDGRAATFPFSAAEAAFNPKGFSDDDKKCFAGKVQNYELIMSFASRPGSQTHCSSAPIAENPEEAKKNPKPSALKDKCEVDFSTAKHCIEPGDLESLSIRGVGEPITHAQIMVANYKPSVTGGDDIAVIRTAMSCEAAKKLTYLKPADKKEAVDALVNNAAVLIARNRNVNVKTGQPDFLEARGYLPQAQGEFSGFAVTKSFANAGQKVIQGDSGGPQVACIRNEPQYIGATSTILVTSPGQQGGNLGRAASIGSLDFLKDVVRDTVSTSTATPIPRSIAKKGADKVVHPNT